MTKPRSLKGRTTKRLLADWSAIMRELRRREAVRSGNSPTGDLAEAMVAAHYGAKPMPNSTPGFDLVVRKKRIQVKSRRRTERSRPSHYGVIRNLDKDPFDILVVVNLDEDFVVESAYRMSIDVVRELARYSAHSNGWRMPIIRGERARHRGIKPLDLQPGA